MKQRLKKYLSLIESIDFKSLPETEKDALRKEMLVQIGFFQHERLVHLIVTVTIAIITLLTLFGFLVWHSIFLLFAACLLAVLLIFYVIHYYTLENGVQKLYDYYDKSNKP